MKYSECCGSPIKFHDICSECGEHCDEVVNPTMAYDYVWSWFGYDHKDQDEGTELFKVEICKKCAKKGITCYC
jgi:hypothetical protein